MPPLQFLKDFYPEGDVKYKKCKSRLWLFNAVSKSNCCDCYKDEKKVTGSGSIEKVSQLILLFFYLFIIFFENVLIISDRNGYKYEYHGKQN